MRGLERHAEIVLKVEYEGKRLRKGEGEEREKGKFEVGSRLENSDKGAGRVKIVNTLLRVVCSSTVLSSRTIC